MIVGGIDAGSRTLKVVLWDGRDRKVIARRVADQGIDQAGLAESMFNAAIRDNGLQRKDIEKVVATGYGRNAVAFADATITEITCHAKAVRTLVPNAATVVDIGGEDSKLIRLDSQGRVRDFAMNDRCAAGTGRFLEVVARRLETGLDALGEMASVSQAPASISRMCVVFAETEIIGLLAAHTAIEDIIAGVQTAIASRVAGLAGRRVDPPVVFTGGVARVSGMRQALESAFGQPVVVAPDPQLTGALGAALLAAELLNG
jgi:(R)-2-hydroxyacyl-CoA dehydratese activating ATPase